MPEMIRTIFKSYLKIIQEGNDRGQKSEVRGQRKQGELPLMLDIFPAPHHYIISFLFYTSLLALLPEILFSV